MWGVSWVCYHSDPGFEHYLSKREIELWLEEFQWDYLLQEEILSNIL